MAKPKLKLSAAKKKPKGPKASAKRKASTSKKKISGGRSK